jgi:hypothetical protein
MQRVAESFLFPTAPTFPKDTSVSILLLVNVFASVDDVEQLRINCSESYLQ